MALPTGVTYFPYIRIPPDAFMTRLLLYWDDVATIVPDQWAYATEEYHRRKLGDFTYELVEAGLVTMAVPQYDLGGALAPFEAHLDDLPGSVMDERIARFEDGEHFKLHKGKFADLGLIPILEERRLALREDAAAGEPWNWLLVEPETASEFMAVLAKVVADATIGISYERLDEGRAVADEDLRRRRVPLTNDPGSLAALGGVYTTPHGEPMAPVTVQAYLEKTRTRLLQNLFPVPTSDVDAEWIINMRHRFGDLLRDFRLAVERVVLRVLQNPEELLDVALDLESETIAQQMDRIEVAIAKEPLDKFERITLAVLAELPGVGRLFRVGRDIAETLDDDPLPGARIDPDFAYGAFLREELQTLARHQPDG